MNAGARLGLYAAGVAVAFAGAFGVAAAAVPQSVVDDWNARAAAEDHGTADGHGSTEEDTMTQAVPAGLSLSSGGFELSPVTAPATVGESGELSFQILDADGEPLREFTASHEKDLHLIAVRSDGALFEHVHPELDHETGTWSTPWQWQEGGSYRVYADFVTGADDTKVTLTRTVEVHGEYKPMHSMGEQTTDEVDGFDVSIDGQLVAGSTSDLTITVTRDGQPVTELEPYLGAFGHLVALRSGDLAYLHVHAMGEDPEPGDTTGPEVMFAAEAPTAGQYLLYLDFQVDGQVHTAQFTLDAVHGDGTSGATHDDAESSDH